MFVFFQQSWYNLKEVRCCSSFEMPVTITVKGVIDLYEDLTAKQRVVLDYIKKATMEKGYPPSVREIGAAVKLRSTSTVHNHLANLERKGYIKRDPTKPRALEIFDSPFQENDSKRKLVQVPVLGSVTAGLPVLAVENVEEYFPLPMKFIETNDDVFMLTINGSSMIEAGIYDGDYVLVLRKDTASNGDIVVALLDQEATVKRFYKEEGYYRLQPENSQMDPLLVDEVTILGKVIGLMRRF